MAELIDRFIEGEEEEAGGEALGSVESRCEEATTCEAELKTYSGFKAQMDLLSHSTKQNMDDYEVWMTPE